MKAWSILILVSLTITACNSPRTGVLGIAPSPEQFPQSSVRNPEIVRAYQLGRVVDKAGLLHEHHTIYRIEANSTWDLHPGGSGQTPSIVALTHSAFVPPPANDEIVAEINRQKEVTQAISAQAQKLGSALEPLMQALTQTKAVAEENVLLRQELSAALTRLTALEAQIGVIQPAVPAPENPTLPQP